MGCICEKIMVFSNEKNIKKRNLINKNISLNLKKILELKKLKSTKNMKTFSNPKCNATFHGKYSNPRKKLFSIFMISL
jgi:hypothetical protein